MTDTPIVDASIRAAKAVNGGEVSRDYTVASLRAALPWDLPAGRLEAMAAATVAMSKPGPDDPPLWHTQYASWLTEGGLKAVAAYRADPIMRELYPERFK